MRRCHRFALLVCAPLIAASVVASCSSNVTAPRGVFPTTRDLQTDSTHYTLVHLYIYVANVGIVFSNRTAQPFTFASCNGNNAAFHLEKLVDSVWVRPSTPTFGTCVAPPAVVPAGGQFFVTFKLTAPFPGTFGVPSYTPSDVPGTYRVVWDGVGANPSGDQSAPDDRITNTFTLAISP